MKRDNSRNFEEVCNQTNEPLSKPVYKQHFPQGEKKRHYRQVKNLKQINQFLYHHFKIGSINHVKELLREKDFMVKVDLQNK